MKYTLPTLSALIGAIVLGIAGALKFMTYGGNRCDVIGKSCDCFCCNSFGLRGYESCGAFGLLIGTVIGIIVGLTVYKLIKNYTKK